jgi:hypothetical protein
MNPLAAHLSSILSSRQNVGFPPQRELGADALRAVGTAIQSRDSTDCDGLVGKHLSLGDAACKELCFLEAAMILSVRDKETRFLSSAPMGGKLRPVRRLLCERLRCFWRWRLADAKRGYNVLRLRRFQELLKLTVFRENAGERLLDNIICRCVDECRILINLRSGGVSEPNGGAEMAALNNLK